MITEPTKLQIDSRNVFSQLSEINHDAPVSNRLSPEIYRKRRIAVTAAGVLSLLGAGKAIDAPIATPVVDGVVSFFDDDRPNAPTFNPGSDADPSDYEVVTVKPSESVWSIAEREKDENNYRDDIREMQDELVEQAGSSTLLIGQELLIPRNIDERADS
ncbi:MAG: hypothetical protein M3Q14_01415 [bacterium]|nr:hypothetical protein [bacterium]